MRYGVTQQQIDDAGQHVEPGTYPARVDKITNRTSTKGNPVMLLHWAITGTEPPAGTKVLESCTMTPESFWRLEDLFASIGVKVDNSGQGFESDDLLGKECKIVVIDDTYEGKLRSKVNAHIPL